jgi:hypothetical protein
MKQPVHTIAQQLRSHLMSLPLWVKQVIYLELYSELSAFFTTDSLTRLTVDDSLAFYQPKLTPHGEKVLVETQDDLGQLLLFAKQHFTMMDVCLRNSWSLEKACILFMQAYDQQWVERPNSVKAFATVEYLGNRIRLGDYLVRMERITLQQLDQALRTQQYIKEALHEHTGLANILINLGYITRQDTEGILFLKQESQTHIENTEFLKKFL